MIVISFLAVAVITVAIIHLGLDGPNSVGYLLYIVLYVVYTF